MPGAQLLDVAGPSDVFTCANNILTANSPEGTARPYQVILLAATDLPQVTTSSGLTLITNGTVQDWHSPIDTLLVAGSPLAALEDLPASYFTWLHRQANVVRRIGSVCIGVFALAKAHLLANRRVTTHWAFCAQLQSQYPAIQVESTPFFVRDDNLYTSGGITSGMDLALILVEEDYGHTLALSVAQKLVLHLRRVGNQGQFNALWPELGDSPLLITLRPWLKSQLSNLITVEQMAEQVHMSPRNFARVFLRTTGVTPAKFVEKLRLGAARRYLEETDLGIEQVAQACGLTNTGTLRRLFLREMNLSPRLYRAAFQSTTPSTTLSQTW